MAITEFRKESDDYNGIISNNNKWTNTKISQHYYKPQLRTPKIKIDCTILPHIEDGNISLARASSPVSGCFFVSRCAVADVEFPVKIVTNDGSLEVNKESGATRAIISRFTPGGIVKTCVQRGQLEFSTLLENFKCQDKRMDASPGMLHVEIGLDWRSSKTTVHILLYVLKFNFDFSLSTPYILLNKYQSTWRRINFHLIEIYLETHFLVLQIK